MNDILKLNAVEASTALSFRISFIIQPPSAQQKNRSPLLVRLPEYPLPYYRLTLHLHVAAIHDLSHWKAV